MAQDSEHITDLLLSVDSIHIIGCGLNQEKPANKSISDLDGRGWRLIPIHLKDAGATVKHRPIRKEIDDGLTPEVVVLFLAPSRALDFVKRLLFRYDKSELPLIWFQHGAKNEQAIQMLKQWNAEFIIDDCIVEYITRNGLKKDPKGILPWFRQTKSLDDDGCSIWQSFDGKKEIELSPDELEWVGDIIDLELSQHIIPRYIRSMKKEGESLHKLAVRLS